MSILNKYKKAKERLKLINDRYYDFVLSLDDSDSILIDSKLTEDNLCAYIDFTLDDCIGDNDFVSLNCYKWKDAVNDGAELMDIGFTGIDNGFIHFNKDEITDIDFYNIICDTTFIVESGDTRMHLTPVTGNTKQYSYEYVYHQNDFISLKGGFLQGVFKLDGFNYQILPNCLDSSMHIEFVLRPTDYITDKNTLNFENPDNKGIFFYIGTRAENKFAVINNADTSEFENRPNSEDFEPNSNMFLPGVTILDSNGNDVNTLPLTQIKTDNKYLLFNHTENGYTVNTWPNDTDFVLEVEKRKENGNMFLTMNHTESGYTVDKLKTMENENSNDYADYNIIDDIKDNAFALKINDDGSIGYRYLVSDCNSENGWSIKEEKSFPNIIPLNEWSTINVRFQIVDENPNICEKTTSTKKMKIYIYVNGYLKFISQELNELFLKPLNDDYTKQECVPFSISLGGGTQGLSESIWTNYTSVNNKILPLEKYFAGTFIGDIKSFKIYDGFLEYNQIRNNYLFGK